MRKEFAVALMAAFACCVGAVVIASTLPIAGTIA